MQVIKDGKIYYIKNMYFDVINLETLYLLDSNIVVELGKMYYNPQSLSRDEKCQLLLLIEEIKEKNIRYDATYALSELAAERVNGGVIPSKYKRLERALTEIMETPIKKMRRHALFSTSVDKGERDFVDFPKAPDVKTVINKTLMGLAYSFAPLAKFFILLNAYGEKDRTRIFSDILEFMHTEIGAMSLYEIATIVFYLFSSDDEFKNAQNLMKVNKQMDLVKKIWNISWDMTYLRKINDLPSRYLSGEDIGNMAMNYILITKDQALANIAGLIKADASINFDGKYVPNANINDERINQRYRAFYNEIHKKYQSNDMVNQRQEALQSKDPLKKMKEIEVYISQMTQELMVITNL